MSRFDEVTKIRGTLRANVAWYEKKELYTAAELARRILERLEAKP